MLVYKQELTDSKEGSKSQGMPAKETTHTTITCTMKAFLTAHGRQLDPALPDGNCLFRALSKQMTGGMQNYGRSSYASFLKMIMCLEEDGPLTTAQLRITLPRE